MRWWLLLLARFSLTLEILSSSAWTKSKKWTNCFYKLVQLFFFLVLSFDVLDPVSWQELRAHRDGPPEQSTAGREPGVRPDQVQHLSEHHGFFVSVLQQLCLSEQFPGAVCLCFQMDWGALQTSGEQSSLCAVNKSDRKYNGYIINTCCPASRGSLPDTEGVCCRCAAAAQRSTLLREWTPGLASTNLTLGFLLWPLQVKPRPRSCAHTGLVSSLAGWVESNPFHTGLKGKTITSSFCIL